VSDRRIRVVRRRSDADQDEIVALLDQTIRVVLPREPRLWRHQVLAIALVDLLARLFPRIDLVVSAEAAAHHDLPPGAARLRERLEEARAHASVGPFEPSAEPAVTIAVGPAEGDGDIYVDGYGWQSYIGTAPAAFETDEGPTVPFGPLSAACRGVSQALQKAMGDRLMRTTALDSIEAGYWSALTYDVAAQPLNEPAFEPTAIEAVLVGAGSIGGAAAYAWARVPGLEGDVDIVDPQNLEDKNPDRAILATDALATAEASKAQVACDALAHHENLRAPGYQMTIAEFVAGRPRDEPLPLVLSAVDSVRSRRDIQDALPLELIDAACSPDEISLSGHRTDDGPCVYCLHIANVLNSEQIRLRLIMGATGFNRDRVLAFLFGHTPLDEQHLREIEIHRGEPEGTYADFQGEELDTLYRRQFLYGETRVKTSGGGDAVVASAFVTALAGFLLAGEALKRCGGDAYAPYRLGALGELPTMYRESLFGSSSDRLLLPAERWPGNECLCRSVRRLRLLRERYGLGQEDTR
jgi:hypothetical protein